MLLDGSEMRCRAYRLVRRGPYVSRHSFTSNGECCHILIAGDDQSWYAYGAQYIRSVPVEHAEHAFSYNRR